MNLHYTFANIKNCALQNRTWTYINYSKFTLRFLDILYMNGFISSYTVVSSTKVKVYLNYIRGSLSLFQSLKMVSKPSRRVYINFNQLLFRYSGKFGIISTSSGLITLHEAVKRRIGGELICLRYYFLGWFGINIVLQEELFYRYG